MFHYDMHIHTAETSPCGNVPAETLINLYAESGYTGLVITDHYYPGYFLRMGNISWKSKIDRYLTGFDLARKAGAKAGLQIFLGLEMRFAQSPNDYLVYGINENFLYDNPELYDLGLEKFRELTVSKGIKIYQAHPFRNGMETPLPELLDGVETFNGNQRHNSRNHLASVFAHQHHLDEVSGSDFHELEDLALGGITLPRKADDYDDFLCMLQSDKSLICTDPVNN